MTTETDKIAAEFAGKSAIVTGAGSGIGAEIARLLALRGAAVMLTDINESAAQMVVEAIRHAGGTAQAQRIDVSDSDSVNAAVNACEAAFGGIDLAVNNAGVPTPAFDFAEIPLEEWTRQISINLSGVFHAMQAELKAMLRRGGGAIVNTSSLVGLVGVTQRGSYAAAKHGVNGITKTAALDYATRNIRVNAIAPGYVDTPLLKDRDAEQRAEIASRHPMNRMAEPTEIAETTLYLLSDRASFVTGTILRVDGGYVAR